jgi:serine/threonine-protein kinase
LFLGKEDEYLRARRELLARFGASTDPHVAERTSRACLLFRLTGDELQTALKLSERATGVDRSKYQSVYPHFQFLRGLAEFRQGQFDRAIATMRGDAARVLGPAPGLVLAMALHKKGEVEAARRTLAEAVVSHDWRADHARNQDAWIFHVLRREAERQIVPMLPEFLAGKYQPRDPYERLAFVGACQYANRFATAALLYAEAFAAAPHLEEDTMVWYRWQAARTAALAGCGTGEEAKNLDAAARKRWREQARKWLRADLAKCDKLQTDAETRKGAKQFLLTWKAEQDFSGLREPAELAKLSPEERKDCQALWDEVADAIKRIGDRK